MLIGGISSIKLPDTSFLHNSILLALTLPDNPLELKYSDLLWASHFTAFGKLKLKRFGHLRKNRTH